MNGIEISPIAIICVLLAIAVVAYFVIKSKKDKKDDFTTHNVPWPSVPSTPITPTPYVPPIITPFTPPVIKPQDPPLAGTPMAPVVIDAGRPQVTKNATIAAGDWTLGDWVDGKAPFSLVAYGMQIGFSATALTALNVIAGASGDQATTRARKYSSIVDEYYNPLKYKTAAEIESDNNLAQWQANVDVKGVGYPAFTQDEIDSALVAYSYELSRGRPDLAW
jgi:hypothetical protein